jgi:glycerol-3-phosphate dehydrogenase (NAD(P)+)
VVGVELCGGLKNVIAIASGIVAGLGLGHNTIAALMTRGLAEILRLVLARGGREKTLLGLAGAGDLMLTCTGSQSRNRRVGEEIGRGTPPAEAIARTPEVAEGTRACVAAVAMAAASRVEMPIAAAVREVLYEGVAPRDAIRALMTRDLRAE